MLSYLYPGIYIYAENLFNGFSKRYYLGYGFVMILGITLYPAFDCKSAEQRNFYGVYVRWRSRSWFIDESARRGYTQERFVGVHNLFLKKIALAY